MTLVSILGDSIFRGITVENGKYRLRRAFRDELAERYGLCVRDLCRFGAVIGKGMEIFAKNAGSVIAGGFTVIEYGGNDCDYEWEDIAKAPSGSHICRTPPELFDREYRQMITEVRRKGGIPLASTLPPIDADRYFDWICRGGLDRNAILSWLGDVGHIFRWHESYSDAVARIAREEKCGILDLRSAFFAAPEGYRSLLCEDGIHPNGRGQDLLYRTLSEAVAA
ncbi:MAG: SGNH/GDSL hydrolase family protein [Oscillospiraceae bacterium]|nr:SGNH/GDSL hydrolase family protein [Oscillospiraceae bacterium]